MTSPQLENTVPDASGSCSEEFIHTIASELTTKVIPSSSAQSGPAGFGTEVASGGISNCGTLHTDVSNKLKISELQSKTEFPEGTGDPALVDRFDICAPKESGTVVLKPSLLVKNREKRNEIKRNMETVNGTVLRPGMILLKGYISLSDQVPHKLSVSSVFISYLLYIFVNYHQ